ncbi:MAG: LysR family transcriptional regulator [Firmicutes bacterium]|nr:LysR family transcriptional regulator [Bacillota bacterium]
MTISDLNAFTYVAATENITTAATVLGITESGLSKTIRRMEDELGYSLFLRRNNRLYLTEKGRNALKISRSILDLWQELNSIDKAKACKGIDVYSTDICLLQNLSCYIAEKEVFSGVVITDHLTNRMSIKNAVKSNGCDFLVTLEPIDYPSDTYITRQHMESFVIVLKKGSIQSESISIGYFDAKTLLSLDKNGPIMHIFERVARNHGADIHISYQIDTAIFYTKIYNSSLPALLTKTAAKRLDQSLVDIIDIEEDGFSFPVYISAKRKYRKFI